MKGYYIRIIKLPSMEIRLQTKRCKSMRVAEEIYQEMKLDTKPGETIVPLTSGACLVKVLILSVHSQYCELIGNERKWYEVRTKLPKGIVEVK